MSCERHRIKPQGTDCSQTLLSNGNIALLDFRSLRSPDLGLPSYLTQRETKVGGGGERGFPKAIQVVQGRARLEPGVPQSQGVALYWCLVISPTPDHKR